jgi:hypothetical protein
MKNEMEKQNEPIRGKVSGVLNERELTINIGSKHGVHKGMKFKILADKPIEIRDPESNELLGSVDREKVQVQASEVYEKFSICKTFRQSIVGIGSWPSIKNWGEMFSSSREVPETLKANDSALPRPLSEEESYVKKGDRVVQIIEVEKP